MNYGISQNSMKLIIRTLGQRKELKKGSYFWEQKCRKL